MTMPITNHLLNRVQDTTQIHDFRTLIHKDVDISETDDQQRSILMFAAQNYHLEVFNHLVNRYPALIAQPDRDGNRIMHYIACSVRDDADMVINITNKKFAYCKLAWMRNCTGRLPKDIARQAGNSRIGRALDRIMQETLSEYQSLARDNGSGDATSVVALHKTAILEKVSRKIDVDDTEMSDVAHYVPICIGSRKRRRQAVEYPSASGISSDYYCKRRKLNIDCDQQAVVQLSPPPLPPLPPTPIALNNMDSLHLAPRQMNNSIYVTCVKSNVAMDRFNNRLSNLAISSSSDSFSSHPTLVTSQPDDSADDDDDDLLA